LSLRFKLTSFYALISALVLTLGGVILFVALRQSLYQSFDDSLREAVQLAVSQLGGGENDPRLETEGQRFEAQQPGATALTIFNSRGRALDRFGDLGLRVPLEPGFQSVGEVRVLTQSLPAGGFIQAARSQRELGRSVTRSGKLLLLLLPALLLVGFGAGYALVDRALRPVNQVTRLASQIAASGRYRQRVPPIVGNDEMARLTRMVNAMLERLESTIERERTFALSAAHELRTPLAALVGRITLTLERDRENSAYRAALREMDDTTRQMTATLGALLTLARPNQGATLRPLDLADVAFEAIEHLEPTAQVRGMALESALESCELSGDAPGLKLAVGNLLENAVKYGREGGRVWIRTGQYPELGWLEVCDDGPGVPQGDLERLKQPFQRGHASQHLPGAGLGLALVVAVLEAHGGRLELSRAEEGGLRARLEVPVQQRD